MSGAVLSNPCELTEDAGEELLASQDEFATEDLKKKMDEAIIFGGLPMFYSFIIATVGAFWATEKDGYPIVCYIILAPFLFGKMYMEYDINRSLCTANGEWRAIFEEECTSYGFNHWAVLIASGLGDSTNVFKDIIFMILAYVTGWSVLGFLALLIILLSSCATVGGIAFGALVYSGCLRSKRAEDKRTASERALDNFEHTMRSRLTIADFVGMKLLSKVLRSRMAKAGCKAKDEQALNLVIKSLCADLPQSILQAIYVSVAVGSMSSLGVAKLTAPMALTTILGYKSFCNVPRLHPMLAIIAFVLLTIPPSIIAYASLRG